MVVKVVLLLACAVLVHNACAATPGIRMFVDNGVQLDDVFNLHLPTWEKLIDTITIPDISEEVKTPVGKITMQLSKIKMSDFSMTGVTTHGAASGTGIDVTGLASSLSLDWHYREDSWPHVSDHGSGTATFKHGTLGGTLVLADKSGKIVASTSPWTCDLGEFDLDIHTSLSWLYDLIKGQITQSVKSGAQKAMASQVQSLIVKYANQYLGKIPPSVTVPVKHKNVTVTSFTLDTAVASVVENKADIIVGFDGVVSAVKAAVWGDDDRELGNSVKVNPVCPHLASFVSAATADLSSLVTLALDESVLNCIMYDLFESKLFHALLDDATVGSILSMNTSDWQPFVPELFTAHPNALISIDVEAASEPLFATIATSSTVNLTAPLTLAFSVVAANKSLVPAFTLAATLGGVIDNLESDIPSLNTVNVTASLASLTMPMTVASTQIGPFNASGIESLFTMLASSAIDIGNKRLASGLAFTLPMPPQLKLSDACITAYDGYLTIAAGIAPTTKQQAEADVVEDAHVSPVL